MFMKMLQFVLKHSFSKNIFNIAIAYADLNTSTTSDIFNVFINKKNVNYWDVATANLTIT